MNSTDTGCTGYTGCLSREPGVEPRRAASRGQGLGHGLSRLARTSAAAAMVLLAGCVVAPVGYYDDYGREYYGAGEVVEVPPPGPRYEVIGVAPVAGHIWINGFWGWRGGRHHWVPGRWVAPRPGHNWVSPHWGRAGNGWRLNRGYWRRG